MAQMPASYLTEKVDDLRVNLAQLDTSSGLIYLSDRGRRHLAEMARNAQAIIDEINQWTGVVDDEDTPTMRFQSAGHTVTFRLVDQPDGSSREEITCTCGRREGRCDHIHSAMRESIR